mmetsp:Transcript_33790/g.66906  ORF Transcript_33790/g.66906 Transcript_33790/m.66906 type:complete len:87 (-) Transcript_33790:158-418(-)
MKRNNAASRQSPAQSDRGPVCLHFFLTLFSSPPGNERTHKQRTVRVTADPQRAGGARCDKKEETRYTEPSQTRSLHPEVHRLPLND